MAPLQIVDRIEENSTMSNVKDFQEKCLQNHRIAHQIDTDFHDVRVRELLNRQISSEKACTQTYHQTDEKQNFIVKSF